jgi:hypothetical protein
MGRTGITSIYTTAATTAAAIPAQPRGRVNELFGFRKQVFLEHLKPHFLALTSQPLTGSTLQGLLERPTGHSAPETGGPRKFSLPLITAGTMSELGV